MPSSLQSDHYSVMEINRIELKARPGETFDPRWDDGQFYFDGGLEYLSASAWFETTADRDALLALLPKSTKARATSLWTQDGSIPGIDFHAKLLSDRVNGGVNESGIRRLRTLVAKLQALGVGVHYRDFSLGVRDEAKRDEHLTKLNATVEELNELLGATS